MADACSKTPLVWVTEDDMCELIDDSDPKNTKKQVKHAVNRINSFAWKHKKPIKRPESTELLYNIKIFLPLHEWTLIIRWLVAVSSLSIDISNLSML